MTITREQEIWGMALWVEKTHGAQGPTFIAKQIGRLALTGEAGGVWLWKQVAHRFEELRLAASDKAVS